MQDLPPEVTQQWDRSQVTIQMWAGHTQVVTVKMNPSVNGSKLELTGTDDEPDETD